MTMAFSHSVSELRMVLLGNKGVGKSATGNAILGREAFEETETTECERQRGRVMGRDILLIDTPGINNTSLSEEQCRREIEKGVALSAPGPHVFVLVIRLERFTEEERNTVMWIQENFGEKALKFTMILFIGREDLTSKQWSNFCQGIQDFTRQVGCGYHGINSKKERNPAQISKILKHINEMVCQNREQYYHEEVFKSFQVRRQQGLNTHEENYDDYDDDERAMLLPKESVSTKFHKQRGQNIEMTIFGQSRRGRDWEKEQGAVGGVTADEVCDVKIVLLGIARTGKSATGNTILGREAFGNELYRRTNTATEYEKQDGMVEHKSVSVIDIQRRNNWFSCTTRTCPMVSDELSKAIFLCSPGPHVFLLVVRSHQSIRISSNKLDKCFGPEFLNRTIVLLTHGDRWGRDHERVFNQSSELQNLLNSCSGFYQIFNNEEKRDRTQVRELMEKIDRVIQNNGRQHYTTEMYLEAQQRYHQRKRCSVM